MAVINNTKSNKLLSGTKGNDTIQNGGSWIDSGNYYYTWHNGGSNVTINSGAGNDSVFNRGDSVTINSGAGNDSVVDWGNSVTIDTGDGNDYVLKSFGDKVTIETGAGNDYVINHGFSVTITGGKGNDSIYNNWDFDENAPSEYYYGKYVLFKYSAGDGNDVIYGFNDNDIRFQSRAAPIQPKKAAIISL